MQPKMYDQRMLVSHTKTTNTMANSFHNACCSNSPGRPVTQTVCQDAQASESANLGKTCKYCVASAAVADDVADATAAVFFATDDDDTVDVVASISGLSLLQFNKCIRAL